MIKSVDVLAAVAALFLEAGMASSQASGYDLRSGLFSRAQVERGNALYQSKCASCHGSELVPADSQAPALAGAAFRFRWVQKTLDERLTTIRSTMPPGRPELLSDQQTLDIIAFVLAANGYPAGQQDLTVDSDRLKSIVIPPSSSMPAVTRGGSS